VVTIKLKHLDGWTAARQANAERYRGLFAATGLEAAGRVTLPAAKTNRHIYNQFVIRAENRDGLLAHLRSRDIGTEIYYPVPLHLQQCFRGSATGKAISPRASGPRPPPWRCRSIRT
jgi:dTDP-4-amino-4,6-dideoxygalactose transaminase